MDSKAKMEHTGGVARSILPYFYTEGWRLAGGDEGLTRKFEEGGQGPA